MIKCVLIAIIFLCLLYVPSPANALKFEGQGVDITNDFECKGGLVKFAFTHDGDSNFIVWLRNVQTGDLESLLVNVIGPFNGNVADDPPAATYLISVDADGKWTIDITGNTTPPSSTPETTPAATDDDGGCFINSLWP